VHKFKAYKTRGVVQEMGRGEYEKDEARYQPKELRSILTSEPAVCCRPFLVGAVPYRSAFHGTSPSSNYSSKGNLGW
jgi:hypothetical protein